MEPARSDGRSCLSSNGVQPFELSFRLVASRHGRPNGNSCLNLSCVRIGRSRYCLRRRGHGGECGSSQRCRKPESQRDPLSCPGCGHDTFTGSELLPCRDESGILERIHLRAFRIAMNYRTAFLNQCRTNVNNVKRAEQHAAVRGIPLLPEKLSGSDSKSTSPYYRNPAGSARRGLSASTQFPYPDTLR